MWIIGLIDCENRRVKCLLLMPRGTDCSMIFLAIVVNNMQSSQTTLAVVPDQFNL